MTVKRENEKHGHDYQLRSQLSLQKKNVSTLQLTFSQSERRVEQTMRNKVKIWPSLWAHQSEQDWVFQKELPSPHIVSDLFSKTWASMSLVYTRSSLHHFVLTRADPSLICICIIEVRSLQQQVSTPQPPWHIFSPSLPTPNTDWSLLCLETFPNLHFSS